jgi:hypothetical protein
VILSPDSSISPFLVPVAFLGGLDSFRIPIISR